MFQVDPALAGGEAMCPMCHGVVAVPADANAFDAPGAADSAGTDAFDFSRKKRGGMFAGLDDGPPPPSRFDGFDVAPHDPHAAAAGLASMGCPYCGSAFQVDSSLAGQQAMCPTCQGVVVIPDLSGATPNVAPPPSDYPPAPVPQPYVPASLPPMPTPLAPQPAPVAPNIAANPHPPGYSTSAAPPSPPLSPPSPLQSAPPLVARSTPAADLPLSARAAVEGPPKSAMSAPASTTTVETLLPPESTLPAEPVVSRESPARKQPEKPGDKPTTPPRRSRAEKIEALLPEQADPDEEVVAERPIAVEEPPEEGIAALVTDAPVESTLTDADGQPIRRVSAEARARLRRIRTLLLFAVGMLVLVLAVVLLPRMGFLIDIGKPGR